MAVLGKLIVSSAQRLDLADFLSIDSYTAGDFKYLIKSFIGDGAYVLKGFDVVEGEEAIGVSSCSFRVADSVLYCPNSSAGAFYYGLPEGNALSEALSPKLRQGVNYIYLTLTTSNQSSDFRAFWDPDQNGGQGNEFSQEVNTESVLTVVINSSSSSFPTGSIPIAKITASAATPPLITGIEDCRNLMFRLGTGGITPNPYSKYEFRELPGSDNARLEPPTVMADAGLNPFQGGDKNIYTLKEWMDAVMTKLQELGGTTYWYQDAGSSMRNVFGDALASTLKSKGQWEHDANTPGLVTWTSDIVYKSIIDPRDIIIRAGSVTLANEQLAHITLIRDADINSASASVVFENSVNYINGSVGAFALLSKGDWIKKRVDSNDKYLRVEEFYSALSLGSGAGCTPAEAVSIRLSGNYAGTTAGAEEAVYTKGSYTSTTTSDRNSTALQTAGGDLFWLAQRSDTILKLASLTVTTVSGTVTVNDGARAKVVAGAPHGMITGDYITVTAPAGIAGTAIQVEVEDTTTFYIPVSAASTGSFTGYYAIGVATTRDNGYSFTLEDGATGFETGEKITIAGTTNFNGTHIVSPRSGDGSDTFQFAVGAAHATESSVGTATAVRVEVRRPFGSLRIVQGESLEIGEVDGENVQTFIGMTSLSQTHPSYAVPADFNAIAGHENFNCASTDSLTTRAAKLTAMMADRVQDRSMVITGTFTVRNTTSGMDQVAAFTGATPTIRSARGFATTISGSASLGTNSVAYATIDRDQASASSITVAAANDQFLLGENRIVLFYRLADTTIYAWDGTPIPNNGSYTFNAPEAAQSKNVIAAYDPAISLRMSDNRVLFSDTTKDITITIPGSSNINTVDTSAIAALNPTMTDGQAMWVRVNHESSAAFTGLTGVYAPDTDGSHLVYITARSAVPRDQNAFIIMERIGDVLYGLHRPEVLNVRTIYEEMTVVGTTGATGTTYTLPVDSRDSSNTRYYVYGSGQLSVFLNGQLLKRGEDWNEVLGSGNLGNTIQMQKITIPTDVITFRIDSGPGVFFTGQTGPVTLQDAYGYGNTITAGTGPAAAIDKIDLTKMTIAGATGSTGQIIGTSDGTTLQWVNGVTDRFETFTMATGQTGVVLAYTPRSEASPLVWPAGGVPQLLNVDYSIDLATNRVLWNATGATGLAAILSAGDVLVVKYQS